ncbi:hypothetical protein GCM10010411_95220 [Actinomadura fulvescens]|uniref:Uncharacterized protein n=1 Tax=Actinomadura fulvescens TaxID=46160 RepID=A0ABN3R075_9ACTN
MCAASVTAVQLSNCLAYAEVRRGLPTGLMWLDGRRIDVEDPVQTADRVGADMHSVSVERGGGGPPAITLYVGFPVAISPGQVQLSTLVCSAACVWRRRRSGSLDFAFEAPLFGVVIVGGRVRG